jgi:hypothetical protein
MIQVLHHPVLQIDDEAWLFEFILECIESLGIDWRVLFEVVRFEYLSSAQIHSFLDLITFDDITSRMWENLQQRLSASVIPGPPRYRSQGRSVRIEPNDDLKFDGIFAYLERESGGDLLHSGSVSIIASTEQSTAARADNVVDLAPNSYFASHNQRNQWLMINFNRKRVLVTHYELRTYNGQFSLKSWVFQGSNDRFEWTTIDVQSNDDLKNPGSECRYTCRYTSPFQYFRIRMNENHFGNDVMVIANLELYGEVHYSS